MAHPSATAAAPPPGYGLAPLPSLPCPDFRGPTPWCNWVLKGRLLAGAYPASVDDRETERILTTLLELGVNTFVCLQAEFSLHTPEAAWRSNQGLRPYIKDAQQLLIRARESNSHRIKQDKLDFLHLPIIDGNVTSDTALSRLADDCCTRILRGERLYIHCWGGHGRTGTLVAVMLGRLYGVACSTALRYTQAFHDARRYPQGVRSPQTTPQVQQVKRLLPFPVSLRNVSYPWDPSLHLDDVIRWPSPAAQPSSSPTPAAQAAPAPACHVAAGSVAAAGPAVASGSPGCAGATAAATCQGVGGSGARLQAAESLAGPHDPPGEAPSLYSSQQLKDAIRAKQGGNRVGSQVGSHPLPSDATAQAVSAAADSLKAASLQPRHTSAAGAPDAPGADSLCSTVDGKPAPLRRQAAPTSRGGCTAHGQPADGAALVGGPRADGYLAQYVQQQGQPGGPQPARTSGSGKQAGGGGRAVNLTASSGPAAWGGLQGTPGDEEPPQRMDLRPSKLTVSVPGAAGEQPSSPMARMFSFLSGRGTPARQ